VSEENAHLFTNLNKFNLDRKNGFITKTKRLLKFIEEIFTLGIVMSFGLTRDIGLYPSAFSSVHLTLNWSSSLFSNCKIWHKIDIDNWKTQVKT
jgi:hypothetical protein